MLGDMAGRCGRRKINDCRSNYRLSKRNLLALRKVCTQAGRQGFLLGLPGLCPLYPVVTDVPGWTATVARPRGEAREGRSMASACKTSLLGRKSATRVEAPPRNCSGSQASTAWPIRELLDFFFFYPPGPWLTKQRRLVASTSLFPSHPMPSRKTSWQRCTRCWRLARSGYLRVQPAP